MREILFRGKRKYSDEWVEGDFYKVDCFCFIIPRNSNGTYSRGKDTLKNVYPCNECIPETIGQYTGLKDKNGKKIFEGDILNTSNSNCRIWYVDYKNTAFCANQGNANYSCVLDEFMQYSSVEVIGDVYDSTELMKGGVEE